MNTFLNVGFISYLKEFDKCYMFSFSVYPKSKNSTTFYLQTVVFKNEWTPKLRDGMKVFVKGNLSKEVYTDNTNTQREVMKLYAESVEVISDGNKENSSREKKTSNTKNRKGTQLTIDISDDEIPF